MGIEFILLLFGGLFVVLLFVWLFGRGKKERASKQNKPSC
jgi:cbb3-type cytochrome oxidase subunit 3